MKIVLATVIQLIMEFDRDFLEKEIAPNVIQFMIYNTFIVIYLDQSEVKYC